MQAETRESLQRRLDILRRNLATLEEQKAKMGLDVTVRVLNEIEDTKQQIADLEDRLACGDFSTKIDKADLDFVEQILPPTPSDEIPRDALVRQIVAGFGAECQQQMVVGGIQAGKTNLLAQLVRQHKDRCISYFITPSPLTQRQQTFLYTMCYQLSVILGTNPPPERIELEGLKSLFSASSFQLARQAKLKRIQYYFVVDGLEQGLEGSEGDRIIDLFPLQTAPRSPYLLFSCRSDQVDKLSEHVKCHAIEPMEFNRLETETYLSELRLSPEEIDKVHKKYHGVPGYLKIIKETKRANPDFDLESAPVELDQLISQQVKLVMEASSAFTIQALEILAASPVSLPPKILAELAQIDEPTLVESLQHTGLVKYDLKDCRVEYCNDLVRESVKERVGDRIKEIAKDLLNHVRDNYPSEEFLLTLLFEETQDYEGLCNLLTETAVVATIDTTRDISNVMRRMRLASEMAKQNGEVDDLVKWTLGITVARSFVSHAVSSDEIRALLSIGESQDALSKAYAIPEISAKIRLLAKAYASMKERGDRVPKSALDELAAMVEGLDLENLDKGMAQEIAVDLLPVLPDVAFSLLERAIGAVEERSIVEAAIGAMEARLEKRREQEHILSSASKDRENLGYIAELLSSWLNDLPLSELLEELRSVGSTEAKEYMIRQWCRQNAENEDIVKAIDLWLDIVVSDVNFVLLLRSLRHMSEVIVKVPLPERKRLIDRLRVPGLTALDSPKEEWIRFHLNLAEALSEIDKEDARSEIRDVHNSIFQSVLELDVKAFCLARLWATISKVFSEDSAWVSEVEAQFYEAFRRLLDDSGEQLEPVLGTIQALVEVDPICALTAASELNTHSRRREASRVVLETTLRKQGEQNVEDVIEDALVWLDKAERDFILDELISKLDAFEVVLASSNLDVLLKYSEEIADPATKARALSNLAGLFRNVSLDDALVIMEQAVEAWRKEDDLRIRLSLGFSLVESMAKLDLDKAKQLYTEVRELKFQPGSTLAVGELGPTFRETLDLAIRAITIKDLSESDQAIRSLESLILRLPSRIVRLQLLSRLAASAYRVGHSQYANDLVRSQVIHAIKRMQSDSEQIESELDCTVALVWSLPVVFEYDFSTAKSLSEKMPYPTKDAAWYSVVLWSLSRSFLGDHLFETEDLRVGSDYPRLEKAINGAREIDHDWLLYGAITAIAHSVRVSFDSTIIDLTQALDILQKLDDLASSKLPERSGKNIKHEGYLVVAQAAIHGARSYVYRKAKRRRGLSGKYMRERWKEIRMKAESISNIADRVFVMALVAYEMAQYYREARSSPRALLEEAESQVKNIPTLIDRADCLEAIADSWGRLGEKTQAEVALKHAFELIGQLESASADDRLSALVQAAYAVDPNFADVLVSRLDTRLPEQVIHPIDVALEVEKLRGNPSKIKELQGVSHAQSAILSRTARKLLQDFAAGRGTVEPSSVLENWLVDAGLYHPRVSIDIAHWVVESLCRKRLGISQQSRLEVFLSVAQLAHELAKWISIARGEGIPQVVHDSFPGLSARVEFFRAGEAERAKRWMQNWLNDNVEDYLKVCDPYFGPEELEYFKYVPLDCRILVVTTDRYLTVEDNVDRVKEELELHWREVTSRALPNVQFVIVPRKLEDRFHDRAIITSHTGLDIGQSLNGLGKSHGKITVLSEEDAKELEKVYVDEILNNATWFLEGVRPTVLFLGA